MAEPKTRATKASVSGFIQAIPSADRRRDAKALAALMRSVTGERPEMWGPSIVGYGREAITGANGKATEWPVSAFAPRSTGLVLYGMAGTLKRAPALAKRLGKHKVGKGCLYITKLDDVDLPTLRKVITDSYRAKQAKAR